VRRVPLFDGRDLIRRHVQVHVMGDDRHFDLAVVPLGRRVAAAAVDGEAEVRRDPVVEQLDALAFRRVHRRDSWILVVVLDFEPGLLELGHRLHAKRDVIDDGAFRAASRLALPQ
jgi:hypothetical protein